MIGAGGVAEAVKHTVRFRNSGPPLNRLSALFGKPSPPLGLLRDFCSWTTQAVNAPAKSMGITLAQVGTVIAV